jgi:LPXTG-motif cell wall-anchored protein
MSKATQNNNPGNIEVSNDHWQGATGVDYPYVIFFSPMWGFRALYKDLYNKITKDGDNTLLKIFKHYLSVGQAPDDHTLSDAIEYANIVSNYTSTGINDILTPNEETLKAIAHGIDVMESGQTSFAESDYNNGYLLFKGEQVATSTIGIGAIIIIGAGAYYLYRKKNKR